MMNSTLERVNERLESINRERAIKLSRSIAETVIASKEMVLTDLLAEIESENYETVGQIQGAIHSMLASINKLKVTTHDMAARQYEADAKADHFTENQF